ncbi:MAG: hypothetical protein ACQESN_02865 [Thermotogota bacterium]
MNKTKIRQEKKLYFLKTGKNIEVGNIHNLPISLEEIKNIDKNSKYIREIHKDGLTAEVFKIEIEGEFYNLKKKRKEILVKNVDGQTSFLNEVQRRRDFEKLRIENEVLDKGIIKTIYANLNDGFILSEWIEGNSIKEYNRDIFKKLFKLLVNIELNGIMEWDVCSGNILMDKKSEIKLFDFGYTYLFNPLKEFNSEGKSEPLFHSVERFETRTFMQYLLDKEMETNSEKTLELYKVEKEEAIDAYNYKIRWLRDNSADLDVIDYFENLVKKWKKGIQNKDSLNNLYDLERFRSYILDVNDDISGKSCTKKTLQKSDIILDIIETKHSFLEKHNGYLWDDKKLYKEDLLNKYNVIRNKVIEYQLKN